MTAFRTLLLQSKLLRLFVRQHGYKSVDPRPRKCADLVNRPVISMIRFGNGVYGRFQSKESQLLLTGLRSKSPVRQMRLLCNRLQALAIRSTKCRRDP